MHDRTLPPSNVVWAVTDTDRPGCPRGELARVSRPSGQVPRQPIDEVDTLCWHSDKDVKDLMAPPDATPKSLFPAAAKPADAAPPGADGSFRTPDSVEFPMFTGPEDDALTAFGSRVKADLDLELLDARVTHVRDVQYGTGSHPPDVSPVVSPPPPLTRRHERVWGSRVVVLAVVAAGVLAGLAGVFFLTR